MAATITAEERDALFAQILLAFGAFEDLDRGIGSGDHELAYKIGRQVSDGLRLILDGGLGFAERTVEPITLNLSDDELRPIISRMKREVDALYESRRPSWEEQQREKAKVATVRDICASVLDSI